MHRHTNKQTDKQRLQLYIYIEDVILFLTKKLEKAQYKLSRNYDKVMYFFYIEIS